MMGLTFAAKALLVTVLQSTVVLPPPPPPVPVPVPVPPLSFLQEVEMNMVKENAIISANVLVINVFYMKGLYYSTKNKRKKFNKVALYFYGSEAQLFGI